MEKGRIEFEDAAFRACPAKPCEFVHIGKKVNYHEPKQIKVECDDFGYPLPTSGSCPDCGYEHLDYSDDDVIRCFRCEANEYSSMYHKMERENARLKVQLATAVEGLEHYADESNWDRHQLVGDDEIYHDCGYIGGAKDDDRGYDHARKTLDAVKEG